METDALTVLFYLSICAVQITQQNQNVPQEDGANYGPLVRVNTGVVMGKELTVLNKRVNAYLGIPYAESTGGERRFKRPVPKEPWEEGEFFNATVYGDGCYQLPDKAFPGFNGTEMWNPNVHLHEDCLNLNVWVPVEPRPRNTPVLVWIYGGSFWYGVASLEVYDGKFLAAEENLIIVSMNYRVGAFGFLATGTDDAPGNQGLYDQALALQWVQDNIEQFGGDPDQVTLFSESAGSASVSFHMLSPVSESLFTRAALQSAGPTGPWTYYTQEEGLKRAKLLAGYLDCLEDGNGTELSVPEIVACLRTVDPTEILFHSWVTLGFLDFPWRPVYDGTFLPEDPRLALENKDFKDCEMLIGSNTNEGFFFIIYESDHIQKDSTNASLLTYNSYLESLKHCFSTVNSFGLEAIAFQYRPWLAPNDGAKLRDAVDAAVGDNAFTCPTVDFALAYAKADHPVYYYRFTERASNSFFPDWMGVLHGDEIAYIFGIPLDPQAGFTSTERTLSRKLMKYWANFARTGDPNRASRKDSSTDIWPMFTVDSQEYLVLNESLVDGDPHTGIGVKPLECAFWRDYQPKLQTQTADIEEAEKQWKEEFYMWSSTYMVNWKTEFDKYVVTKENSCTPKQ